MKQFNFLSKTKWLLVPFMLITFAVGNVWGTESVYYTMGCPKNSSNTTYAQMYDITVGDIRWKAPGNQNVSNWKLGGKLSSATDRYMYTKDAIETNVSKIVVTYGSKDSEITVNSVTLEVYSTASKAAEGGAGDISTVSGSFTASSTCTFNRPSGHDWTNRFYRLTYNMSSSASGKNKGLQLTKIEFYEVSCSSTLTTPDVTATPSSGQIQLTWPAVTNATKYQVSWNGGAYADATSPYTKTSLSNGTTYSWAVKAIGSGTYCNSDPVEGSTKAGTAHAITWKVNGETYKTTYVTNGDNLVLPTNPSSCKSETEFVGWSASTISGTTTTKPTFVSTKTTITAAQTYHAVFATKTSNKYALGNQDDLIPGREVLIVNPANNKALSSTVTGSKLVATTISISNSTISNPSNDLKWIVNAEGARYQFKFGNNYLNTSTTNSKLYCDGDEDWWTLTTSNSRYILLSENGGQDLQYYSSAFSGYKTGTNDSYQMDFYIPEYKNYFTSCCTALGSINGSVSLTNENCGAGELKAKWKMSATTGIASQVLHIYKANDDSEITGKKVTNITAQTTDQTFTISGLDNCTAYYVKVENISSGGSYCADGWAGDPSSSVTTKGYTYGITKTNVTLKQGADEEANTCAGNFSAQYEAAAGYELPASLTVTGASTHTWSVSEGVGTLTINAANVTGNVSTTIAGTCVAPSITVDPADAVYALNASATALSVTVEGAGAWCGYQWESKVGNGNWTDISAQDGGTAATFTPSTTSSGTTLYRVKVTNIASGCSSYTTSEEATVEVSAQEVCADPEFSIPGGTKLGAQSVTLDCETENAAIYYTTNGDDPQVRAEDLYDGSAIAVNQTTTIKAIAAKSGATSSAIVSATYTIKCKAPTCSVTAGTYSVAQSVELASEYGTVYYTVDGSDPATNGVAYSSAIAVEASSTIRAIAKKANCLNSEEASAAYTLKCATPQFSPAAGNHLGTQNVEISSTEGAAIYYTTDGITTPTTSSTLYEGAITVSSDQTIKAIAVKDGWTNSDVATAAYTIEIVYTVSFSTGVGNTPQANITETSNGGGITLPAGPNPMSASDGWSFAGWSKESCDDETVEPVLYPAGNKFYPSANTTLYAVYVKGKTASTNYRLVSKGEEIVSGENYVIAAYEDPNDYAITAATKSTYYIQQTAVTVDEESDAISNPAANIIWTMTNETAGTVSLYNADQSKYLYVYQSENKGKTYHNLGLSDSKKTFNIAEEKDPGYSSTFAFVSTDYTSCYISYDGSHDDFGTATSSGEDLYLYKRIYTGSYESNPCVNLSAINGEVTWSDATTAVLTWEDLENVDGTTPYNVTYRTGSAAYGNTNVGSITTNAQGKKICSITGLTPCANYDFMITANPAEGYCEKDQTINDTQAHAYSVEFTLTGTTKKTGDETSCASANYEATFQASSAAYELPDASGVTVSIGGNPATITEDYTWVVSEGVGTLTVLQASIDGNITISIAGVLHNCEADPILGTASLSGTFNLSTVGVSCEGIEPGSYCAVESGDYGFIWYAGTGDKEIGDEGVHEVAISTGDYSSGAFAAELSGTFSLGSTYTFRAFAENTGDNVGYSDAVSFTPRSVTFNKNNGEDNVVVYVNSGSAVAQPSNPSKTGYEFVKWQKEGSDYDFESPVSSNITLDAVYNANTYTVTLAKNYGSAGSSNVTATFGQNMPSMGDKPGREGYEFTGYYANNDGTGTKYYNADKSSAHVWDQAEDKTIYAAWSPKNYTIILNNEDADTGHEGTASISVTYDSNENLTGTPAIELPEKTGYVFGGYFTNADGEGTQIIDAAGNVIPQAGGGNTYTDASKNWKKAGNDNVNLYAYWRPSYTVTWSVNNSTTTEQVISGEKVAAMPTAPTSSDCDDAKVFVGWRAEKITGTSTTNPGGIFTDVEHSPAVTEDVTFFAVFADVTGGNTLKLTFPDDNSSNNKKSSYGNSWTATKGDYSWSIENFNNNSWNNSWAYIKCGHDNTAYVGTIATSQVVPFEVDSVIIDMTVSNTSNLNSATLYISSNSDFSSSSTISIPVSGDDIGKIGISSSAEDKYYKIAFDCKAGTKPNVVVNSVTYKQSLDTANFVTKCASCDDPATFTNTTPAVSEVACTGATVTAEGGLATLGSEGCNISDYGFVIGASENPEIDGEGVTKLQVGTANPTLAADFSYEITGLVKGTQYNVRAYAINKYGIAYNSNKSFWTKGVSSIAITTAPTKTNYIVGETFDATGMEVTATLAGGATDDVTTDVTYSTSALTVGEDQDFTISYTLCETEKTATQKINVYTLSVNEGTYADKGVASYTTGATFSVGSLAEHTTFNFDVTNGSVTPNGDGSYTVTPDGNGNVTVTVNYVTAVPVDVKYYVNGQELTGLAKNPYQSEEFDMPDASAVASAMSLASINVGDVNFVGWSTTPFGYQTGEPTLAGASVSVMEATNYYAVFTNLNKVRIDESVITSGSYPGLESTKQVGGINFKYDNILSQSGHLQLKWNGTPYGYIYNSDEIVNVLRIESADYNVSVYACTTAGTTTGSAISAETREDTDPYVYILPANTSYFKLSAEKDVQCKPDYIDIYYAPEAVYYTTLFQTLTFNKADGNKDKDEMVAKNKAYALTEDDAPATVEHYTFLYKWLVNDAVVAVGESVTADADKTLIPITEKEISGETPATENITDLPAGVVNVVVAADQELKVNAGKSLDNLTVEAGGTVTVAENMGLEVNNITIESQVGKSGQLIQEENASASVNGDIYLDIKLLGDGTGTMNVAESQEWYCISAPFEVSFNDGFFWADGTPMGYNVDFQAFVYDGGKRASNGTSGWQRVGGKMEAGKAYLIGFDDDIANHANTKTIRLKAMSNAIPSASQIDIDAHDADVANKDWNGVGNPTLHYIALDGFTGKVQCYNNGAGYSPYDPATHNYVVGTALFMQAENNINLANPENTYFRAPRRESEENEQYSFCVEIAKEGATRCDNRLYVSASDEATSSYEPGKDMLTMNGTSSKFGALIWTENYGKRLASEDVPMVNNKATYSMGIFAPNAGTYVLSTTEASENATLYLTKNGRIYWNLTMGECELDLAQGQNNEYGLVLRAEAPAVTTGIENGELLNGANGVQKVVIDEHVYILRGGEMYDMTGKAVK